MKRVIIDILRAILKVAIFLTLARLLVVPVFKMIVSLKDANVKEVLISILPQILGVISQILLMWVGILIPQMITQRTKKFKILSFIIGLACIYGIYRLALIISTHIIKIFAIVFTGVFSAIVATFVALLIFYVLIYLFLGPWAFVLAWAIKDD